MSGHSVDAMATEPSQPFKRLRARRRRREPADQGFEVPAPDLGYNGVGTVLAAARQDARLSLERVAKHLRLRPQYLRAIEAGRFDELPGRIYALGFIRTYANLLDLDADAVVEAFRRETADVRVDHRLLFPVPQPEDRTPRTTLVALTLVAAVAIYGGWRYYQDSLLGPGETVMAVPERLVKPAAQLPPSAAERGSADTGAAQAAASGAGAKPAPVTEEPAPVPDPAMTLSPSRSRIEIRASADSWLQIRSNSGEVLVSRLMRAGDRYEVPNRPGLKMLTGNAGGLEFLVDGETLMPLGRAGEVLRNVVLDPDLLKGGVAAAAPAQ